MGNSLRAAIIGYGLAGRTFAAVSCGAVLKPAVTFPVLTESADAGLLRAVDERMDRILIRDLLSWRTDVEP